MCPRRKIISAIEWKHAIKMKYIFTNTRNSAPRHLEAIVYHHNLDRTI